MVPIFLALVCSQSNLFFLVAKPTRSHRSLSGFRLNTDIPIAPGEPPGVDVAGSNPPVDGTAFNLDTAEPLGLLAARISATLGSIVAMDSKLYILHQSFMRNPDFWLLVSPVVRVPAAATGQPEPELAAQEELRPLPGPDAPGMPQP
jgi:hypothetical protein